MFGTRKQSVVCGVHLIFDAVIDVEFVHDIWLNTVVKFLSTYFRAETGKELWKYSWQN
jgi:hypothetical protein